MSLLNICQQLSKHLPSVVYTHVLWWLLGLRWLFSPAETGNPFTELKLSSYPSLSSCKNYFTSLKCVLIQFPILPILTGLQDVHCKFTLQHCHVRKKSVVTPCQHFPWVILNQCNPVDLSMSWLSMNVKTHYLCAAVVYRACLARDTFEDWTIIFLSLAP